MKTILNALLLKRREPKRKSTFQKVETYLVYMFAIFMLLGSYLNVYAQSGSSSSSLSCFDLTEAFRGENELSDTETTDKGLDAANLSSNNVNGTLGSLVLSLSPESFCNYEAVAANPDIPISQKRGILTIVDDGIVAMYNEQPQINVYAHIVNEWVPGESVATSVYAQDGFDVLVGTGINDLWEKSRLIAYTLFVIALIIAGFMIMFRQKIGGQLAVTIFNTIPEVIMGLILVTFSFAIVGLMINLGAVLTRVAGSVLQVNSNPVVIEGPLSLAAALFEGSSVFQVINVIGGGGIVAALVAAFSGIGAAAAGAAPALPGILLGGAIAGGIVIFLIALVIIGIVLTASIKVYITLLKAYLGILLDTILGPIIIAVSVAPGQSGLRADWFRRVAKNVLTFPAVFFVLNLSAFIFNSNFDLSFPRGLATGDLTAAPGGTAPEILVKGAVLIYLFFLASEVPKILDDFLPVSGGKNTSAALQGAVKGAFGKIPIIGGMIG